MTLERLDARGVIERLSRARAQGSSGLAFDADGTIWSGDVGEDVFESACEHELIRSEARDALEHVARAHGLSADGTPSALARRLYEAYRRHALDELLTCEIMTFCYAGFTLDELAELARRVLSEKSLSSRVRGLLGPVFEFAAREGLRVVVVSASPEVIVAEGLRIAGIEVAELGGAGAAVEEARILPRLAGRVPYGPEKVVIGKRLLGASTWLGSFGDNAFDVDMLKAAQIGVAVCPKPALAARLGDLSNTVILE
jgi:phosphatidylglycerophosphatase C